MHPSLYTAWMRGREDLVQRTPACLLKRGETLNTSNNQTIYKIRCQANWYRASCSICLGECLGLFQLVNYGYEYAPGVAWRLIFVEISFCKYGVICHVLQCCETHKCLYLHTSCFGEHLLLGRLQGTALSVWLLESEQDVHRGRGGGLVGSSSSQEHHWVSRMTSRHFQISPRPRVKLTLDTRHGESCQAESKGPSLPALQSWKQIDFQFASKKKKKKAVWQAVRSLSKYFWGRHNLICQASRETCFELLWDAALCWDSLLPPQHTKILCISAPPPKKNSTHTQTIPDGILTSVHRQLGL